MNIPLPSAGFNSSHIFYADFGIVPPCRSMDAIREVLVNIDVNAPWLPKRYYYADWCEVVATRANIGLRHSSIARDMIGTGHRTYDNSIVTRKDIASIVTWISSIYRIKPFCIVGDQLDIRVENVPKCPYCGNYYELMWKQWGVNESFHGKYNLLWCCPVGDKKCKDARDRIWHYKYPEFIDTHGGMVTFFHNWESDGYPIPHEYYKVPLTEWSLTCSNNVQTLHTTVKEVKVEKKQRDTSYRFTDEELDVIRDTYKARGWMGFFDAFPKRRGVSKYDVQEKASRMGLTRKINRKRKHDTSIV